MLFKQVYFNLNIRNNILYYIINDVNCKTINYRHCYDVYWLIINKHWELLKYKLKNKEYLNCTEDGIRESFKIDDLQLFIMLFNRFKNIYKEHWNGKTHSGHAIKICAGYGKWHLVFYLMEQGFNYQFGELITIAIILNNYEILKELKLREKNFITTKLSYADLDYLLNGRDKRIISFVFSQFKFKDLTIEQCESVLVKAMKMDLEIFKSVQRYIESTFYFFSWRRDKFYHQDLLYKLYKSSVHSIANCKYLHEHFDMSFALSFQSQDNPFVEIGFYGNVQVFQYLIDNNMFNENYIQATIDESVRCLNIDFIKHIISNVRPIDMEQYDEDYIQADYKSLEDAQYMIEVLGVHVKELDVESASSIEEFKYYYNRFIQEGNIMETDLLNHIIYSCFQFNNAEILLYLHQQGVSFLDTDLWSYLGDLFDNVDCTKLFETLFTIYPPTLANFDDLPDSYQIIEFWFDPKYFIMLFNYIVNNLSSDLTNFSSCYKVVARSGRIKILEFLFNHQIPVTSYTDILEEASRYGNLNIIKYIIYNRSQEVSNTDKISILDLSLEFNHFDCAEFIFPYCTNASSSQFVLNTVETLDIHGLELLLEFKQTIPLDFNYLLNQLRYDKEKLSIFAKYNIT